MDGKLDLAAPAYKTTLDPVASYRAIDDYTFEIKLKNISASFLTNLGVIGNMVYPKQVSISEFANYRPVGSGPYQWVSYQADVDVVLKRNANYWKKDQNGDSLPYLDGIHVFIIPDDSARRAAFVTGQYDISMPHLSAFPGKQKEVEERVKGVQWWTFYANLAVIVRSVPPYTDQRLRTALDLAIDRQDATQLYYPGESKPYLLYSSTGSYWSLSEDEIAKLPGFRQPKTNDLAEAKRLLDAALKDAGLSLDTWKPVIKTFTTPAQTDPTTIVANQWKRNLGINVQVSILDRPTSLQVQTQGTFEMYVTGVNGSVEDPSQNFDPFVGTGGGLNYGRFSDPEVDKGLAEIERTLDPAKRKQLSQAMERRLAELHWDLIILGDPRHTAARPEVKGFYMLRNQDRAVRHEVTWLDK